MSEEIKEVLDENGKTSYGLPTNQVIEYVYHNYKSYKNKTLIVEEYDNCFHIKANKDESPLILGKEIIA